MCMIKAKFANVSNEDDLQWKRTSDGILPQISKVKYLSKNLGLCDQSKLYKCVKMNITSNGRRPQMEDCLRYQK